MLGTFIITSNWKQLKHLLFHLLRLSKWPLNLLREPAIYAIMECLALVVHQIDWSPIVHFVAVMGRMHSWL
jgi:hypothetical protein